MTPVNLNTVADPSDTWIGGWNWSLTRIIGLPFLILYLVVILMVSIGFIQVLINFNEKSRNKLNKRIRNDLNWYKKLNNNELPGVSILRPIKGIDSEMEKCLESVYLQDYPINKIEIIYCFQDSNDIAIQIVEKIINKYPNFNSKIMIDEEGKSYDFGPNPKINNLHKGYKNCEFDIVWIIDSNIFFKDCKILERSVYSLENNLNCGSNNVSINLNKKVKIITHVPIVLSKNNKHLFNWGSKLDEMFMSTSHCKFYIAFNRIEIAPCINGKSNMFKKHDLDLSVSKHLGYKINEGEGLKHFAKFIGEDNMIGISLFDEINGCSGMSMDFVYQPIIGENSVRDYIKRRVRWLRVRKYMVLMATLLEPTTESFISGLIGGFAIDTVFKGEYGVCWSLFVIHLIMWIIIDWTQYNSIHYCNDTVYQDNNNVNVHNSIDVNQDRINCFTWLWFWLLRELLALPIWIIAVLCGSKIDWRGQQFRILPDLTAERV